jgi:hypothetical protein
MIMTASALVVCEVAEVVLLMLPLTTMAIMLDRDSGGNSLLSLAMASGDLPVSILHSCFCANICSIHVIRQFN